jgi:protein tyrosine phosphatase (PTP) superfamily phosphohydrolase (DUF442 family)
MKGEATIGGIVVGGQPDENDLRSGRFGQVINVRPDDEPGNVTAELLRGSGIPYAHVPYTADTLSAEHIGRIRELIDQGEGTALLH